MIVKEGMRAFSAPDDGVTLAYDRSWCVEVISVDVKHLNRAGGRVFLLPQPEYHRATRSLAVLANHRLV